jgi:hypothetical protein
LTGLMTNSCISPFKHDELMGLGREFVELGQASESVIHKMLCSMIKAEDW